MLQVCLIIPNTMKRERETPAKIKLFHPASLQCNVYCRIDWIIMWPTESSLSVLLYYSNGNLFIVDCTVHHMPCSVFLTFLIASVFFYSRLSKGNHSSLRFCEFGKQALCCCNVLLESAETT